MAKYIVLNTDTLLPMGKDTSQKKANEIGSVVENFDVISDPADFEKHYKLAEIIGIHNSVVASDDEAVIRFKSKAEAADAAFKAAWKFDYSNDPVLREGVAQKPGRKNSQPELSTGSISLRDDTGEGWTHVSEGSLRGTLLASLIKFIGNKKSVTVPDFQKSVGDVPKFVPTLRHLMRCGQIIVMVNTPDGKDLVEWMTPDTAKRDSKAKRDAVKAEREAAKDAKKKVKKAKKKVEK